MKHSQIGYFWRRLFFTTAKPQQLKKKKKQLDTPFFPFRKFKDESNHKMSYDPMAALDMEKRLGIKNSEIDSFLTKANAVQEAIKGLKDGTIDPTKEIKIEGIETESEKQAKAAELAKKKEDYLAREAKKKARLKEEEKQKWWRGAELFRDVSPDLVNDNDEDNDLTNKTAHELNEDAKRAARLLRYSSDYSRWEQPVVDDPATKAEQAEMEAEKEAKENAEFEKNNPDFCGEFRADQEKRAAAARDKETGANVLRLKGNRFFKAKKYSEAIEKYMASLKVQPYTVNTLTNIALAHHKKCNYEEALEFCDRAVYLNATHIKARCRRAASYRAMGNLEAALKDAQYALSVASLNIETLKAKGVVGKADGDAMKVCQLELDEVNKLLQEVKSEITDREVEKKVEDEAIKAKLKDDQLEEKVKKKKRKDQETSLPKHPTSNPGFKKVAIEMDSSSSDDDDVKEGNTNQTKQPIKSKQIKNHKKEDNNTSMSSVDSLFDLNGQEFPFEDMELPSQYKLIDELMSSLKDPEAGGLAKSGLPALDVLAILLKESKEARVYLRTSGDLMFLCCRLCGGGLAAPTPVSNVIGARPDGEGFDLDDANGEAVTGRPHVHADTDPARTMTTIAAALEDERRSKVLIRDQGVLKAVIDLMLSQTPNEEGGGHEGQGENKAFVSAKFMMESMADGANSTLVSSLLTEGCQNEAIKVAALALVSACVEGVNGDVYAHCIATNATALKAILSTLPSKPFSSKALKKSDSLQQRGQIRQFALAASLFRVLCLVETCRDSIFKNSLDPSDDSSSSASLTESFRFYQNVEKERKANSMLKNKKQTDIKEPEQAPDPVSVLACAMQSTHDQLWSANEVTDKKCRQELLDAHESAAGALANLALHSAMRHRFSPTMIPLLKAAITITRPVNKTITTAQKNQKKKKAHTDIESLADDDDDVLAQTSAFALAALMNVLISETSLKKLICDSNGVAKLLQLLKKASKRRHCVIRARAAGLLSRLAGEVNTIKEIRQESNLTIIANAIANNRDEAKKSKDPNLADEREHLVRVLATTVSGKGCEAAVLALHKCNTLSILASFLPNPCRAASGDVTAASVVMPSPDRVSFKLCGNVVRCFVAVMENPLSEAAQRLIKEGLLERLVSLLANTQELAVRKNVAVVLAKAMRDGRAKDRVRELRGMEMLVQLGPQL